MLTLFLQYFPDFSRLVEGHLDDDKSTSSATVTASESESPQVILSGALLHPSSASAAQHTPVNPTLPANQQQPGSAVFKVSGYDRRLPKKLV